MCWWRSWDAVESFVSGPWVDINKKTSVMNLNSVLIQQFSAQQWQIDIVVNNNYKIKSELHDTNLYFMA